jgi:transposase
MAGIDGTVQELVHLPPYSPVLNPIEECLSFTKAWLQWHEREAVNPDVHPWLIHWASLAVTAGDRGEWFKNSRYLEFDNILLVLL